MIFLTPITPINSLFPSLYIIRQYSMVIFVLIIFLYCIVQKRFIQIGGNQIILYIIAILIWSMIGIYNGYNAVAEASPLLMVLLTFIAVVIASRNRMIKKENVKHIAYALMITWCGLYFFLAIGLLFGVIPIQWLMPIINVYMQANNSLTLTDGFLGILPRIGAGVNIVPLIIYGFFIYENKKYDIVVWLLMFFYTVIDYGRVDIALFSVLTLLNMYRRLRQKNISNKIYSFLAIVLLVSIFFEGMAASNISFDELYEGYTARYDRPSDERTMQIKYINEYIENKTVMGYGLGAYTPEYTRSDNHWVYENQFHAFVMQMGIVGFLMIIFNYLILFFRTVYRDMDKKYLMVVFICSSFWLLDCAVQGGLYHNDGRVICVIIYMLTRNEDNRISEDK